jgi:hypothetical protein
LANLWICGIAPPVPHAAGADSVVFRQNTEMVNKMFENADTGIGDMHFSCFWSNPTDASVSNFQKTNLLKTVAHQLFHCYTSRETKGGRQVQSERIPPSGVEPTQGTTGRFVWPTQEQIYLFVWFENENVFDHKYHQTVFWVDQYLEIHTVFGLWGTASRIFNRFDIVGLPQKC